MLITELKENYPKVYESLVAQSPLPPDSIRWESRGADINNTLHWDQTKEGREFWSLMHHNSEENIRYAKELQPQLFSEDKLPYKVLTNGLFK